MTAAAVQPDRLLRLIGPAAAAVLEGTAVDMAAYLEDSGGDADKAAAALLWVAVEALEAKAAAGEQLKQYRAPSGMTVEFFAQSGGLIAALQRRARALEAASKSKTARAGFRLGTLTARVREDF